MEQWKDTLEISKIKDTDLHKEMIPVSLSEIGYSLFDLYKGNKTNEIERLKSKIQSKKVIVIDNAAEVCESYPQVIEWLFNISTGIIILLG